MDSLEKTKHKEEKLKREKTIQAERERKRVLNEAIKRCGLVRSMCLGVGGGGAGVGGVQYKDLSF